MAVNKKTSKWHIRNESNTVFVFIHGFFSDSEKCWTNSDGTFWPDLISTDARIGDASVFMANYYTDIDSGTYKVSDCASEVFADLLSRGINKEESVLERDNIVFICHSLGGIVARYMIERNREYFSNKAIALVLIASPSYGSDYADKFARLITFYKNGIAKQLKKANGSLQDLDDRFRDLVHQRTIPKLVGAEAIEHHFIFHWKYLPGFDPVVTKESAARYFGAGKTLPGTNHSTCVKPDSHNHVAHKFLEYVYTELFLPIAHPPRNAFKALQQTERRSPNPLFEVYDTVDEPFYLERQLDNDLSRKAHLFSVWLYGNSGMGKTACTRRNVFQGNNLPIQVYIGALSGSKVDHVALLSEIYFTVCGLLGVDFEDLNSAHKIIEKVGSMLVNRGLESGIFLVIDEIPLMEEADVDLPKFLQSIISLISLVKRLSGVSHAGVILNSIFDPTQYISDPEMKIAEQIKFLPCTDWNSDEIIGLSKIISGGVNVKIDAAAESHLVNKSAGSPRFVKTYFKNVLSYDDIGKLH